jgi:hypothetical protein
MDKSELTLQFRDAAVTVVDGWLYIEGHTPDGYKTLKVELVGEPLVEVRVDE